MQILAKSWPKPISNKWEKGPLRNMASVSRSRKSDWSPARGIFQAMVCSRRRRPETVNRTRYGTATAGLSEQEDTPFHAVPGSRTRRPLLGLLPSTEDGVVSDLSLAECCYLPLFPPGVLALGRYGRLREQRADLCVGKRIRVRLWQLSSAEDLPAGNSNGINVHDSHVSNNIIGVKGQINLIRNSSRWRHVELDKDTTHTVVVSSLTA